MKIDQRTLLANLEQRTPGVRLNASYTGVNKGGTLSAEQLAEASAFWRHCQPLLSALFNVSHFASPLLPIEHYRRWHVPHVAKGRLWLKADHLLPITGSVKARGAIYELFQYAQQLATASSIEASENLQGLLSPEAKSLFSAHEIIVGSTGNLGLAVGKIARALGFAVSVHMSVDAKQWKKKLLRELGARVIEHQGDYSQAVSEARELSEAKANAYFVDDESSQRLMLGYAMAGFELQQQLTELGMLDSDLQVKVLLPCGVGGAPVGISLGLNAAMGMQVWPFLVEPVDAPCYGLALATGEILPVQSIGLSGQTAADGLAVGQSSPLALSVGASIVYGTGTVTDQAMLDAVRKLYQTEQLKIEPSAAAGLAALEWPVAAVADNELYIVWSTGGGLLPEVEFSHYLVAD